MWKRFAGFILLLFVLADSCVIAQVTDESLKVRTAKIGESIKGLSANSFSERRASFSHLVRINRKAVGPLMRAAVDSEEPLALRCVAVLVKIASKDDARTEAIAALEQIAEKSESVVRMSATRALSGLRRTPEDRAIDELSASGAILKRNQLGAVEHAIIFHEKHARWIQDLPEIKWVVCSGPQVTDAAMKKIAASKTIRFVTLSGTAVTDDGFKQFISTLSRNQKLEQLSLVGVTRLSNQAFAGIGELSCLRTLNVTQGRNHRGKISSGLFRYLSTLPSLREVSLFECDVHAGDIAHLRGCPLERLCLAYVSLSDGTVGQIVNHLPRLKKLDFAYTKLPTNAVETLVGLYELERLNLSGTKIGDNRLQVVGSLPSLKEIVVKNSGTPPKQSNRCIDHVLI